MYIYIIIISQPLSSSRKKKTCQDHFFKTCSIASREFLVNFFREICCILFLLKMALACDACLLPRSSANLKIQQNQERWLVACSLRLRGNIWGASWTTEVVLLPLEAEWIFSIHVLSCSFINLASCIPALSYISQLSGLETARVPHFLSSSTSTVPEGTPPAA